MFPLIYISKPGKYENSRQEEVGNDWEGWQRGGIGGASEVLVMFYCLILLIVIWVWLLTEAYFMICVFFSMYVIFQL